METIYNLQKRASELRGKTETDSISPEEVGGLHADTLAYIADMEQSADGLGIRKDRCCARKRCGSRKDDKGHVALALDVGQ